MSSYEDVMLEAAKFDCTIMQIECHIMKRGLIFMRHIMRLNPDKVQLQILHGVA